MRSRPRFLFALSASCLLALRLTCALAQQTVVVQAPVPPQVYHNKTLGFTMTFPAELEVSNDTRQIMDQAASESAGDAKKNLVCVTLPFMATHQESGNRAEAVILLVIDFDCLKAPDKAIGSALAPIAESSLRQGLQKVGTPAMMASVPYKLAARDAVLAQGSVPSSLGEGPAYAAVSCTLVEHSTVCWEAFTWSVDRLQTLLQSKVAFGDQPAAPIVPFPLLERKAIP